MNKPIIILGNGGHTKSLLEIIRLQDKKVLGVTDPFAKSRMHEEYLFFDSDEAILKYSPSEVLLVNGIGSTNNTEKRTQIYNKFHNLGYKFDTLVHPSSIIAKDVILEEGVQVMPGVIVQPGSKIKSNSIINTKVSIDHDCTIGSHVHIAPGVTVSGNVYIDDKVHVGAGATIIQGIVIEQKCLVASGAVVIKDVKRKKKVKGVPAKEF